tara:strand:- start:6606 stop:6941 length:336 start_codon:yes stop_codon:yes gene_type:complete
LVSSSIGFGEAFFFGAKIGILVKLLSVIGYLLSVIGYLLSVIGYRLSVIGYRLIGYLLSVVGSRLSVVDWGFWNSGFGIWDFWFLVSCFLFLDLTVRLSGFGGAVTSSSLY